MINGSNAKVDTKKVSIKSIVGKGYKDFWKFKGRYRVVKGGRASKKSTTESKGRRLLKSMRKFPISVRTIFTN